MNLREKLVFLKQHSEWKFMYKKERLAEHDITWRQRANGLSDLRYRIIKESNITACARKILVDITVGCLEEEFINS